MSANVTTYTPIDAIIILPEHLHMIITPKQVKEYPKSIRVIKYIHNISVE